MKGILNCSGNLKFNLTDESKNNFFPEFRPKKSVTNGGLTLEFSDDVENGFSFYFNNEQLILRLKITQNNNTFGFEILPSRNDSALKKYEILNNIKQEIISNINNMFNIQMFTLTIKDIQNSMTTDIYIKIYSIKPEVEVIHEICPCLKKYNEDTNFMLEISKNEDFSDDHIE
jgi:hypothetical protein